MASNLVAMASNLIALHYFLSFPFLNLQTVLSFLYSCASCVTRSAWKVVIHELLQVDEG